MGKRIWNDAKQTFLKGKSIFYTWRLILSKADIEALEYVLTWNQCSNIYCMQKVTKNIHAWWAKANKPSAVQSFQILLDNIEYIYLASKSHDKQQSNKSDNMYVEYIDIL